MANKSMTTHDAMALMKRAGLTDEEIDGQLRGKALTVAEAKRIGKRVGKYSNIRTWSPLTGRTHASAGEAKWAGGLVLRRRAGEITDLEFQRPVTLPGGSRMIPDARYVENGRLIHHEFKGFATKGWEKQVELWRLIGPTEYRITYLGKREDDVIVPEMPDGLLVKALLQLGGRFPAFAIPIGHMIDNLKATL